MLRCNPSVTLPFLRLLSRVMVSVPKNKSNPYTKLCSDLCMLGFPHALIQTALGEVHNNVNIQKSSSFEQMDSVSTSYFTEEILQKLQFNAQITPYNFLLFHSIGPSRSNSLFIFQAVLVPVALIEAE